MLKKWNSLVFCLALVGFPCASYASSLPLEPPGQIAAGSDLSSQYISDALEAANKGVEVVFPYIPHNVFKIYTQEGFVTDIRLEPNEVIQYIGGGDTLRWKIDNAESGGFGYSVSHIFIKPLQVGISTNLIINTDKRVYQLLLESGYMYNPIVSWIIPKTKREKILDEKVKSYSKINPLTMNFKYKISDKSLKWAPESVFRTDNKTYFKMKSEIVNSELPAFFELDDEGKMVLVSFRYVNGYIVVDKLIDKGVFLLGKKEVKVTFKG